MSGLRQRPARKRGVVRVLFAVLVAGLLSVGAVLFAFDSKTTSVTVSVAEEILLSQTGTNVTLKVRLSNLVTAQVWGDSSTACSSPVGSLSETASGTYSIPLNTVPFGTNQNNYV